MTPLLIATLAVGLVLTGLILIGKHATRAELASFRSTIKEPGRELHELRREVAELDEQMTRIEGLAEELRQAIEVRGDPGGAEVHTLPYPRRPVRPNDSARPSSRHGMAFDEKIVPMLTAMKLD